MKKCAENCMQSQNLQLRSFFLIRNQQLLQKFIKDKISALSLDFLYFKIILGIAKKSLGIQIMVL